MRPTFALNPFQIQNTTAGALIYVQQCLKYLAGAAQNWFMALKWSHGVRHQGDITIPLRGKKMLSCWPQVLFKCVPTNVKLIFSYIHIYCNLNDLSWTLFGVCLTFNGEDLRETWKIFFYFEVLTLGEVTHECVWQRNIKYQISRLPGHNSANDLSTLSMI